MLQEEIDISHYIRNAIYLYECGANRLRSYMDTGDSKYLEDSNHYLCAADIYMQEIIKNEDN